MGEKTMMRKKLYLIFCLILICMMGQTVYANELQLEQKTEADTNFKNNSFHIEYSKEWTSKGETIKTYDVSDTGKVAIAFSNSKIGVFDENMNFLFELSFKTSGAYGVLWKDENVLFLDLRSKTAVECDERGEIVNEYTINNTGNYWEKIVENRRREYKNYEYFCTNKSADLRGAYVAYYTILKRISENGEEVILYRSAQKVDGVLYAVLLLGAFFVAFTLFIIMLIITIVRKEKGNDFRE